MSGYAEMLRQQAREALPPVEGEVPAAGLHEPVEVIRDRWGVPHVYAEDVHDLFFAASYVVTSERLFQQDFLLRLANGRLASMLAELALPLDRFFRTVGFNRAGRAIAAGYDDLSREIIQAAVAGSNAWIEGMPAKPVEYDVLGLDPQPYPDGDEGAAYAAAFSVFMSWILSTNWDCELLRAEIADRLGFEAMQALFPAAATDPAIVVAGKDAGADGRRSALALLGAAPLPPSGQGSNNWVVDGSRTVTGKPLLANDPHLLAALPSLWFEIHLTAPGIDVRGVTLPLVAGVQIGHSDRIAWGFTNVGGDTQDLYLERLNGDRTAALYEGVWEPVTVHREEIEVRGHAEPVVLEVPETRHGPVLDSYLVGVQSLQTVPLKPERTYALQWTGLQGAVAPSTTFRLATARTMQEFREALRGWHCPGQNVVYADVDGNIGYQCTGAYPIRRKGDGTVPVPGWSAEFGWDGVVPFEELPWSVNPAEGFLATANQKIHDDSYPYLIGKDFLPPHRARRIVQMITAEPKHSKETFARMHSDTVSLVARDIVPSLLEVEPADDRQKEALSYLEGWDGDLRADSAAAAIYQVWCKRLAEAVLLPKMGRELFDHYYGRRQWSISFQYEVLPNILRFPSATWFGAEGTAARDDVLRASLDAALRELTSKLGEDMAAWTWGSLHRITFASQLALLPGLDELLSVGGVPWGGDEQTVCQGMYEPGSGGYDVVVVPSWRQILDLSDWDACVGTHTVGQSGNPASEHFADLFPLWSTGQYHPLPYSRAAVEAAAESTMQLLPG
ncbi:MAG TPA: penicillin acylase family protein [Actinomycetota bacterium]|nr:penicillin acylase family protein [Actinomycetota bacterium]